MIDEEDSNVKQEDKSIDVKKLLLKQRMEIKMEKLKLKLHKCELDYQERVIALELGEEVNEDDDDVGVMNKGRNDEYAKPKTGDASAEGSAENVNYADEAINEVNDRRSTVSNREDMSVAKLLTTIVENSNRQQLQILDAVQLPHVQLMTYDGDPLMYHPFMKMFEANVERSTVDAASKLARLVQCCSLRVRQVIACCSVMNSDDCYDRAKYLLKERFGNKYKISSAWVDTLTNYPCIKPNDNNALLRYSDDLTNCFVTLNAMDCLSEVNNQKTLVSIISKLPAYLQSRWRKEVGEIRKRKDRNPNIEDVSEFVKTVANEANDPVYGACANSSHVKLEPAIQQRSRNAETSAVVTTSLDGDQKKCRACGESHALYVCPVFKVASVEERLEMVKAARLCFNCLNGRHTVNNCRSTRVCDVPGCGKKHSKFLHRIRHGVQQSEAAVRQTNGAGNTSRDNDNGETRVRSVIQGSYATNTNASGNNTRAGSRVALPVVPVLIRSASWSTPLQTYALLDTGSTGSFCSKQVASALRLHGREETLSLNTLGMSGQETVTSAVSLLVSDSEGMQTVTLPTVYVIDKIPVNVSTVAINNDLSQWPHLRDIPLATVDILEVGLLIGQNYPEIIMPIEVRRAEHGSAPYAVKTLLGWTINGPLCDDGSAVNQQFSSFVQIDGNLECMLEKFWQLDSKCERANTTSEELSVSDKKALTIWNNSLSLVNGHYAMDIPTKIPVLQMPDNKNGARLRLEFLRKRLMKDDKLRTAYQLSIEDLLLKGYAEQVPAGEENSARTDIWYLPHHPVINPNKPGKLRIVFDCAAKFDGVCLNDMVLRGPDLANKLVGVLLRFRQEPIAIMADIEAMFHQVVVSETQRDLLRFLWWPNADLSNEPVSFRMRVHLFGGVWSPSCCNFALRRTAEDHSHLYEADVSQTVNDNFYVDDCLKSLQGVEEAKRHVVQLQSLLQNGGFKLTKWISNSREVLSLLPASELGSKLKNRDLDTEDLPIERALGATWDVEADEFSYQTAVKERPNTRRGMLSTVCSVFDPLGFICPFVVRAKRMVQEACRMKLGWDDDLPHDLNTMWLKWLDDLPLLSEVRISRCEKPKEFGNVQTWELHHFSDASREAYGAVSYLRGIDEYGKISSCLVMAKSRLAPLKQLTIPRLELLAATTSVRLDNMLRKELRIDIHRSYFWTDSTIVLYYVRNEDKVFQTFVANRVSEIREHSVPDQWRHIDGTLNPGDDVSRGLTADDLVNNTRWFYGPEFLRQSEPHWPVEHFYTSNVPMESLEIRKTKTIYTAVVQEHNVIDQILHRRSSWHALKKDVAWLLRCKNLLLARAEKRQVANCRQPLTVSELKDAEMQIISLVQRETFPNEMKALQNGNKIDRSSCLFRLEPLLNNYGVLEVGGRLPTSFAIIPKNHHVAVLIVRHYHEVSGHSGKEHVLSLVKRRFWIVGARMLARRVLRECTSCRRIRARPMSQRMADLPSDRVSAGEPPFTYVGVDLFGPFMVKQGRSVVKRYGCLFTCLVIRCIHIEIVQSLETDSFINGLSRFICRRGNVKSIRSDNGTNFVGADKELRTAIKAWNQSKVSEFLLQREIAWLFNTPAASHMGGAWERQIRTVRKVLASVMKQQVTTDEVLSTVMCHVEFVINSRPLTTVSDDPRDLEPLSPNHLLLLKSTPPLLVETTKQDVYRRRWKQAQYLSDIFWKRWLREYLPTLQLRSKWQQEERNVRVGDVVIIVDDNMPRCTWPLGRVVKTFPGHDGLVRSVEVATQQSVLTRPIHKLCLLETVDRRE
jgi:hypothetical protein